MGHHRYRVRCRPVCGGAIRRRGCGSRRRRVTTQASADSFADKWHIPHRHGSYEALVNDPDVDIVYIGTPHPFHYENTLLCLNAGKHVLVEKPFAMNAHQTEEMIRLDTIRKQWGLTYPVE